MQFSATDNDGDYLRYRVLIYNIAANNGTDCTGSSYETATQTASQTGWSGQDTQGNTAYVGDAVITNSTMATYTYQGTLANSTTYCWQADAIDPGGSNVFGATSSTRTFTTVAAPAGSDNAIQGGVEIRGGSEIWGGTAL